MNHEVEVPCEAPDEALRFLVEELGFRPRLLMPADDPTLAEVEGHGLLLRLVRPGGMLDTALEPMERGAVVSVAGDDWTRGRAGMRYRDLLPGRLGGRVIASHIAIDGAGPVPDRVHFHEVGFQLIHCLQGWVRVVYEDQGEPFVLAAGDGLLQPPGIRHRVLESGGGLEVFELAAPAVHGTRFDPDLQLPTPSADPERCFSGQRFVRYRSADTCSGVEQATGGLADVRRHGDVSGLERGCALQVVFVERGQLSYGDAVLGPGDLVARPAGAPGSFHGARPDLAVVEVRFHSDPTRQA